MSKPRATAGVILGLLKFGLSPGYDVKRVTDFSTRYFWRASYGQIFELRALEKRGSSSPGRSHAGAAAAASTS